ncbi:MAG: hypothetical protein ABI410_21010, partial [Rhodoferax sp.]
TAKDVFDYEEVNLSTPKTATSSILSRGALVEVGHARWATSLGAAARSELRRPARLQPATEVKIAVNPAPLHTIDSASGTLAGTPLAGAAAQSYWAAHDLVGASGKALQIVESFETVQAF